MKKNGVRPKSGEKERRDIVSLCHLTLGTLTKKRGNTGERAWASQVSLSAFAGTCDKLGKDRKTNGPIDTADGRTKGEGGAEHRAQQGG